MEERRFKYREYNQKPGYKVRSIMSVNIFDRCIEDTYRQSIESVFRNMYRSRYQLFQNRS